jgi:hypothetical protein
MKTAPVNMGDTGVFTVSVSPTNATGTVTLWDAVGPRTAATSIGGGTATVQFPWPQAGSASLYAVYSGDPSNATSSSTSVSFTVQKGLPQVKLVAPATASPDAQVSLSATVTGNPANSQLPYPIGAIEFWDSLNGGAAQLLTVQNLTSGPGGNSVYATRLKLAPGSHSLHVHYRGDTNWQPADSTPVPLVSFSFTVSVSPSIIGIAAASPGAGTVTVTPSGGFSANVSLTCGTGGTFIPAGYTCTFGQSSLPVNNAVATTPINLTPMSATAAAVRRVGQTQPSNTLWGATFAASILLLGIFGFGIAGSTRNRNFFLTCGLVLCVSSIVFGCGGGGGGGGGGGPVTTTTTIVSSNLKVAFGMPVTFTVTVKPNGAATPSGAVQLYDNGQAYGSPVNVSAGIASFLSTSLPVGVHNFTADYRGDSGTQASTSGPISQAITGTIGLQISGAANGITETADFTVAVN